MMKQSDILVLDKWEITVDKKLYSELLWIYTNWEIQKGCAPISPSYRYSNRSWC